jgi:hypothetical protein
VASIEIDSLGEKAKLEIFSRCKTHLDDADIVIALLDGSQVDDGTAWEIGYFFAGRISACKEGIEKGRVDLEIGPRTFTYMRRFAEAVEKCRPYPVKV